MRSKWVTLKYYSIANLSGKVLFNLSYYTELTFDHEGGIIEDDSEYAWYLNINFDIGNLSLTGEYKDYKNVVIGQAVNEPPALIKQHIYRTLNRSTHVPIPIDESGWQIEASYYLENGSSFTFNHALAKNELFKTFYFKEFFLEYSWYMGESIDAKAFVDYTDDEFKAELGRTSTGFDIDYSWKKKSSLNLEYEYQTFERFDEHFTNMLVSFGYSKGSKFTASALVEYSNDANVIEDGETFQIWAGTNVKYKPGYKDTFLLFAGTRRGGPACTSGVCYEILDFEGVELRYTRRL